MIRRNLGKMKVIAERTMGYGTILNFAMVLYLYAQKDPLGVEWYFWVVLMAIALPILAIFDWKVIYPEVLKIGFGKKNKEFLDLKKEVNELRLQSKNIEEKLDYLIKRSRVRNG